MSDITVINDSEQSSLVTNGLAKNGELYLKAAGSTDAGAIVVYDSGSWRTFTNEASSFANQYSLDLDGTNDYLEIPTGTFDLGTSNWAFSFWFKFDSAGTYGLLDIGNSGGSISVIMMSATSLRLTAYSPANNVDFDATVSTMATDTWQHFLFQKYGSTGGSQTKMYLNGVLLRDGVFSSTTNFGTNTNTSSVGKLKNYFGGFNLPGNVDEFAYFSNSLSDGGVSAGQTAGGDVADIYNSGVPNDISSLSPVGWWRMGEDDSGSGTTITDQGSGGNNGTLTNGPTFSTDVPS